MASESAAKFTDWGDLDEEEWENIIASINDVIRCIGEIKKAKAKNLNTKSLEVKLNKATEKLKEIRQWTNRQSWEHPFLPVKPITDAENVEGRNCRLAIIDNSERLKAGEVKDWADEVALAQAKVLGKSNEERVPEPPRGLEGTDDLTLEERAERAARIMAANSLFDDDDDDDDEDLSSVSTDSDDPVGSNCKVVLRALKKIAAAEGSRAKKA